jgi:hypothetical protein
MVDVRRSESLWCQTGVVVVIGQDPLLSGGYMQRGVKIRHASEFKETQVKFKFGDASATRSHDLPQNLICICIWNLNSPPKKLEKAWASYPSNTGRTAMPCDVLELYSRGRG